MSGYIVKNNNSGQPRGNNPNATPGINNLNGAYIGVVTKNTDSLFTGRVSVSISDFGTTPGSDNDIICLLSTPFGGIAGIQSSTQSEKDAAGSPRSFGMWPQPPGIGTSVVVLFTASQEQGVVVGSLITKDKNYMLGGNASSVAYYDDKTVVSPSTEKNPHDVNDPDTRPSDTESLAILTKQGLLFDYLRGHSQSSARRESPSAVFGITTLGGHVLTLDDGNASGESKNIRIKTKGGAQILIDDTTGTVLINNQRSNAYIEMDINGKIDMYSESDISVHSEGDYNVHAKGSINMQADIGINLKSTGTGIKLHSTVGNIDIHTATNLNLQADANGNLLVAGNWTEKAGRIDMNGPVPNGAEDPSINELVENTGITSSVASRVPEHHPWKGATGKAERIQTGEGNK